MNTAMMTDKQLRDEITNLCHECIAVASDQTKSLADLEEVLLERFLQIDILASAVPECFGDVGKLRYLIKQLRKYGRPKKEKTAGTRH